MGGRWKELEILSPLEIASELGKRDLFADKKAFLKLETESELGKATMEKGKFRVVGLGDRGMELSRDQLFAFVDLAEQIFDPDGGTLPFNIIMEVGGDDRQNIHLVSSNPIDIYTNADANEWLNRSSFGLNRVQGKSMVTETKGIDVDEIERFSFASAEWKLGEKPCVLARENRSMTIQGSFAQLYRDLPYYLTELLAKAPDEVKNNISIGAIVDRRKNNFYPLTALDVTRISGSEGAIANLYEGDIVKFLDSSFSGIEKFRIVQFGLEKDYDVAKNISSNLDRRRNVAINTRDGASLVRVLEKDVLNDKHELEYYLHHAFKEVTIDALREFVSRKEKYSSTTELGLSQVEFVAARHFARAMLLAESSHLMPNVSPERLVKEVFYLMRAGEQFVISDHKPGDNIPSDELKLQIGEEVCRATRGKVGQISVVAIDELRDRWVSVIEGKAYLGKAGHANAFDKQVIQEMAKMQDRMSDHTLDLADTMQERHAAMITRASSLLEENPLVLAKLDENNVERFLTTNSDFIDQLRANYRANPPADTSEGQYLADMLYVRAFDLSRNENMEKFRVARDVSIFSQIALCMAAADRFYEQAETAAESRATQVLRVGIMSNAIFYYIDSYNDKDGHLALYHSQLNHYDLLEIDGLMGNDSYAVIRKYSSAPKELPVEPTSLEPNETVTAHAQEKEKLTEGQLLKALALAYDSVSQGSNTYVNLDEVMAQAGISDEELIALRSRNPNLIWIDRKSATEIIIKIPNAKTYIPRVESVTPELRKQMWSKILALSMSYKELSSGENYILLDDLLKSTGITRSELIDLRIQFSKNIWIDKQSNGKTIVKINVD